LVGHAFSPEWSSLQGSLARVAVDAISLSPNTHPAIHETAQAWMEPPDDLERLAADWITLWESEIAALGRDAELAEAWAAGVALMAAFWRAQAAGLGAMQRMRPDEPAPPRDASKARPAPAAAAPDAGGHARPGGDDDAAALRQRLAELERRLAAVEGGSGGGAANRRAARRPAGRRRKPRA
jgi:hypothetical protein